MERWRLPVTRATVTVGDGMWACQAMRIKQQKLRIAKLYANEQRILRATTNMSEESVSGAHTSPSWVHARLDRFKERSHCKWFDRHKNDAWKINCWQFTVSLSHHWWFLLLIIWCSEKFSTSLWFNALSTAVVYLTKLSNSRMLLLFILSLIPIVIVNNNYKNITITNRQYEALWVSCSSNNIVMQCCYRYSCGVGFPILIEWLLKLYSYRPWCEWVLMHLINGITATLTSNMRRARI